MGAKVQNNIRYEKDKNKHFDRFLYRQIERYCKSCFSLGSHGTTRRRKAKFSKIAKEAKALFADYIVFKAKARKFIDLLGMPYGQMWANEYELRAAKYFDFLLN